MVDHEPQISQVIHDCAAKDAEELHEVMCPECRVCDLSHKVMPADLVAFTLSLIHI